MKWFKEVFLPSFDNKFNQQCFCWVTEKQVNVFLRYMKARPTFDGYYIIVGDYQYTLRIMKKGYGKLSKEDKRVAFR